MMRSTLGLNKNMTKISHRSACRLSGQSRPVRFIGSGLSPAGVMSRKGSGPEHDIRLISRISRAGGYQNTGSVPKVDSRAALMPIIGGLRTVPGVP